MKTPLFFLACGLIIAGPLAADDRHEFTSSDGTKTFHAQLIEYDSRNNVAVVRRANGQTQKFKLDLLSEEDQEFVRSMGSKLLAMKALRISTDMNRGKSKKSQQGTWTLEKTPYHYDIVLENTRNNDIDDVEIEYVIFCERNRKDPGMKSVVEQIQGSEKISLILPNSSEYITTSEVVLEEWSDNPPMPSGGGGGGG